ncbi:MAG: FAD-binding oxidoreductase [Steroidobacteraceae bacterium]|jgi:D-lactate dehydrogenase (cytochrome)|nr:FAD-binding oxidoreductase [Steroidobacteraceae bacterium]
MTRECEPIAPAALDELKSLLGPGGYLDAPADIEPFVVDHRRRYRGDAPLVALPDSTAAVSALLRRCAALGVGVVPHGGNTGYCGAATPRPGGREIVVSLRRMGRIRAVEPAGNSITVEAGCILQEVQAAAEAADRLFPMSLGSGGSCTIGGNLSTNAGGTAVLRYGMMRDLVLGLEVVLPDGRVLDQLRALRKDNTGYDLRHLFIGAEGSLGIITAACLKLFPRPRGHATAFVALDDPAAAVRLLDRLRAGLGDTVTTFELVPRIALDLACRHVPGCSDPFGAPAPWYVLLEVSLPAAAAGLGDALEARLAAGLETSELRDAVIAASLAQREALWRLRESIPAAQTREGASLKHDISIETHALPAFVEAGRSLLERLVPGSRLVAYGHLGDGNLHFNLSGPAGGDDAAFLARGAELRRAVHDLVASYRGSFSAEHGIGQDKVAELERYEDPVALDLMRGIKRLLDPQGIMNPGKVLRGLEEAR